MLLVEGASDRQALPILANRIIPNAPLPRAIVVPKGDLFNPTKVKTHVRFATQRDPAVSKVLVCVDSECTPVEQTRKLARAPEAALRKAIRSLGIKYVFVDHSLEGWFLCDRAALRKVLGKNARLPRRWGSETECRPAEYLANIFRNNGRDYIKARDAKRLAREISIKSISAVSDTFRDFQQAVLDP